MIFELPRSTPKYAKRCCNSNDVSNRHLWHSHDFLLLQKILIMKGIVNIEGALLS